MRRLQFIVVPAALLLFLAGCASLGDLVRKPEVSVIRVVPTGADFEHIDLEMELLVKNPNPVGIRLAGYDYDLTVDGASFFQGSMHEPVELAAEGSSTFKVPLTLNYRELFSSLKSLADETESAYRIETGFLFNLPVLGDQRLELSYEGVVPHIKVPEIRFGDIEVTRLSLTGADIRSRLTVRNPNGFDFSLKDLGADLQVNGISWAELKQSRAVELAAGKEAELSYDFSLDFINMGRLVYKLLSGEDRVSYDLQGNLLLGTELPFFPEADLPLSLSGVADLNK
jgi:LEA14-like dessication related protein